MQTASGTTPQTPVARKRRVPDYLIKEVIDGTPFYYRGYKSVLNHQKKLEDIMGWSGLQGIIVSYFTFYVLNKLDLKKYRIFSGGTGNHLGFKNNMSLDISIFERSILTADKITSKYVDVPAKIVIEIDIQAEWDDKSMKDVDFINLKTNKLFEFGTQKLIWILSRSKKVLVATPGMHWMLIDWNEDIEVVDGIRFNVGHYLDSEGINPNIY
jgi:hypothetical protein